MILGNAFRNDMSKLIADNLCDNLISYIAETYRSKMGHSFKDIYLGDESNISMIDLIQRHVVSKKSHLPKFSANA